MHCSISCTLCQGPGKVRLKIGRQVLSYTSCTAFTSVGMQHSGQTPFCCQIHCIAWQRHPDRVCNPGANGCQPATIAYIMLPVCIFYGEKKPLKQRGYNHKKAFQAFLCCACESIPACSRPLYNPGLQEDVAHKHESIDKLHSKIQNLTDLLVQARYNQSHDLPVAADEAVAHKTPDEQVNSIVARTVHHDACDGGACCRCIALVTPV